MQLAALNAPEIDVMRRPVGFASRRSQGRKTYREGTTANDRNLLRSLRTVRQSHHRVAFLRRQCSSSDASVRTTDVAMAWNMVARIASLVAGVELATAVATATFIAGLLHVLNSASSACTKGILGRTAQSTHKTNFINASANPRATTRESARVTPRLANQDVTDKRLAPLKTCATKLIAPPP